MEAYENYALKTDAGQWVLDEARCQGVFNDEVLPVSGFDFKMAMTWMRHMDPLSFDTEYFEEDCEICPPKPRGKKKLVPYLEGHFYVFTKNGAPVTTSIAPDFEAGSFEMLCQRGVVDQSYILSVILCPNCGSFQLSLEQVDM